MGRFQTGTSRLWRTRRAAGLSLIDLLVSISVIAVLLSILLPSLSSLRETTRQVICRSNIRQLGLGVAMYAEDWQDRLPFSDFAPLHTTDNSASLDRAMAARDSSLDDPWDGLGRLYSAQYLPEPGVFYCPSHRGEHTFREYQDEWIADRGVIMTNYQYRGAANDGTNYLSLVSPRFAMVTDGLQTRQDFSHEVGGNLLRADMSVSWFSDPGQVVIAHLPDEVRAGNAHQDVLNVWKWIEDGADPRMLPGQ